MVSTTPKYFNIDEGIAICKELPDAIFIGNESDFEKYVADNIKEVLEKMGFPDVIEVERQVKIQVDVVIRIDILVKHADLSYSVIEIKNSFSDRVRASTGEQCKALGQLLLYKNVLTCYYTNSYIRLFLIDNKIHYRTLLAFSGNNLPISLIQINNGVVFSPYFFVDKSDKSDIYR